MWHPSDNPYDNSPPQQIPRQLQPGQHVPPPLSQMASYNRSAPGDMYDGTPDYTYGDLGVPANPIPVAPPHGITAPALNSLLMSSTAPQHGNGRPFIGGFVENPSTAPAHGHQSQQFAIDVMASQLLPNPNQRALPSIPQHDDLPIPPPHRQSNLSSSASTPNLNRTRSGPGFGTNNSSSTLITSSSTQTTCSTNSPSTEPTLPDIETPADTHHVGPAPRRQVRRYKTTKRVELVRGNLVLDCQVPSKLLASVERKREKEFTHMSR
ncbi:hypothetical protein BC937DRAFT_87943 [Endogone sp. FLAS-F59071]|nr:hypothetical protein BC937DRAFT_87943 [Endogone sp. FLAS-F59071]|eukprot:RUS11928.1 hypothetical protein BC937DRAFT_87943 [Endogone sp. FLAS-F59071]